MTLLANSHNFIDPNKPALVLAPMDGVTDHLMRRVLTDLMPFSYCVTEFVRISTLVPPERSFIRDMPELTCGSVTRYGTAVQLQLLGGNPDLMAEAAASAVSIGATGIDINFGCPAPTVNRHDGGATLLKYPERIEAIVSAVRSAVPKHLPVSAKLRLGWEDPTAIYENAQRAARGGASWITIHGRTKMQGYTPPAYWQPIGRVRRELDIPVVANGEIWCLDDLKRCEEQSGGKHFMIGRGALAEPGMLASCAEYLGLPGRVEGVSFCGDSPTLWLEILSRLATESRNNAEGDRRTVARIKQWLNYAHKRRTISWFDRVKTATDSKEIFAAIANLADLLDDEQKISIAA